MKFLKVLRRRTYDCCSCFYFDFNAQVAISYLEIYNDCPYDLLGTDTTNSGLPRVIIQENEDGVLQFYNLSIINVAQESEALNLLFLVLF